MQQPIRVLYPVVANLTLSKICFFKLANPGLFSVYFRSFQTNNIIFTTNKCEKMSSPSSTQDWNSNPQPLKHESSPITTITGTDPINKFSA